LADEYQIPQSITDRIAGATVHFSPVDTNIGFAHPEIGFWMLPTVQHYVSYTAVLEERNAEALTGPGGPAFILHKPTSKVDKHNTAWESPLLMHTIWCSFEPIDTGNGWTLFEPTGSSCESVRQLGPAVVLSGSEVVMPPDVRACDGLVTFRINGAERSEVDRLMQLAIRLPRTTVNIADKEWPLFTATANQPHIIAAPESDLGWLGKGTDSPAGLASSMEVDGLGGYFGLHTAPELVFECWQKP
jgi:hypothetical protein